MRKGMRDPTAEGAWWGWLLKDRQVGACGGVELGGWRGGGERGLMLWAFLLFGRFWMTARVCDGSGGWEEGWRWGEEERGKGGGGER
jgi:hypothetical protein